MTAIHRFTTTPPRVLTRDEARRLQAEGYSSSALLAAGLVPPIAGGSPDGDEGGDGDGDSDDGDSGDDDDDGDGSDDGDDGGDGDSGDNERTKAELAAARKRAAEAEKARRKAERKLAERERKDQESQGEYKRLYEEQLQENTNLRQSIRDGARDREVASMAAGPKFKAKDASLVVQLVKLPDDAVDEDGEVDTRLVERALRDLKKSSPFLFEEQEAQGDLGGGRQRNGNGNGDGGNGAGGSGNGDATPGVGRIRAALADADATART